MTEELSDLTLEEEDRRTLILWAVACVERLLPIFEVERPEDTRLTEALDGAQLFTEGQVTVGAMRKLAFGCHAAARDATSPGATAVARAAGQATAIAHMAAHSREVARYTAKALSGEGLAAELAWQRAHVPVAYLSYVYP